MHPDKQELIDRFVDLVERLDRQMRSRPPEEWPDIELTMPQVRTLLLLSQGPEEMYRMGTVAAHLGSSLSSATSMIDRLVDKGLVERASDPQDRRVVTCKLTHLGRQEMERFWRMGRMRIMGLTDNLTPGELQTVVHAIELLYSASLRDAPCPENQEVGHDASGS